MNTPDKNTINRTLDNTATPEEARQVAHWFATPEGAAYLSGLIDQDTARIKPGTEELYIEHPLPSEEMHTYMITRIQWQRKKRVLLSVAAILIPLLILVGQFWYLDKRIGLFDNTGYEELVVPNGERMQLVFQDGSKATLNSGSRIKYPRKFAFSERKVTLEGEAFFDIVPNKNRPFIVDLDKVEVEVLGTTFNVNAYPQDAHIFVTLETGKVSINAFSTSIALLNPGEQAIYNRQTGTCEVSRTENIHTSSAWKNNQLIFNNTPLPEVVNILTRWYNVKFTIADPEALQYTYTLITSKKELREVLSELEKITPVHFIEEKGQYRVIIKK